MLTPWLQKLDFLKKGFYILKASKSHLQLHKGTKFRLSLSLRICGFNLQEILGFYKKPEPNVPLLNHEGYGKYDNSQEILGYIYYRRDPQEALKKNDVLGTNLLQNLDHFQHLANKLALNSNNIIFTCSAYISEFHCKRLQ